MTKQQPSRREALKTLALISAGAGAVLLGGFGLSDLLSQSLQSKSNGPISKQGYGTKAKVWGSPAGNPSLVNINIIYIGMPIQQTGVSSETMAMSSSSTLQDLVSRVEKEHPALAGMLPTMQILLNGMAPYGNPVLKEGDEVDFLPFSAGG